MTGPGAPLPQRHALQEFRHAHPGMDIGVRTELGEPAYYAKDGHGHTYQAGTVEGLRAQVDGPLVAFEDASKPSIARVYDHWLGGKTNFAADRDLATKIEVLWPHTPAMVRENRDFLKRAVRWVASQGIVQFIDAGAGLPTVPAIHHMAREVIPAAHVAYIDNEILVIRHWQSQYTHADPGLAAVAGNLRCPSDVLATPELASVIDLDRPACVILALVFQFQEKTAAREIAAAFARALAPGSFVIITVPTGDARLGAQIAEAYTAGAIHTHSSSVVRSLFEGSEVQPPGLADARAWMPHGPVAPAPQRDAIVLAGVGRMPQPRPLTTTSQPVELTGPCDTY